MKKTLKNIMLVYYSIYVDTILSALLGYYILRNGVTIDPLSSAGITLQSVLILLIIGSVPLTLWAFNKMTKKWATLEDKELKLKKYQKGSIIRLSVMGFGLITGVIFYYVMQSQSMLFCAGISAIGLFFCKPSEVKIITDLNLDDTNEK